MHTYNTRSNANKLRVIHELIAKKEIADADRITVTVSATGEGKHLRWHWSEDSLGSSSSSSSAYTRDNSPSNADASDLTDADGDSEMGDEERLCTPQREVPYDPGSVVLTPRKGRVIKREDRIGGGFDFWQEQDGVTQRLAFSADGEPLGPVAADAQQLSPTICYVRDAIENQRQRYQQGDDLSLPSGSVVPALEDDDEDAETVIIDPRATPQPTLFRRQMPIVRVPTLPAEYEFYDLSRPGPSRPLPNRLSTIQEDGEAGFRPAPRIPERTAMRFLRDAEGRWVREGSLGPDAEYHIDRECLPPKIEPDQVPAPPHAQAHGRGGAPLRRTDTEPVLDIGSRQR
ncbi:hypothetical protein FKP32DRAFT_1688926 [Trametes sanguinea]|nr:hypothetical protein FKP32DRAFT_1688926 [Trametes sanguinea]